MRRYHADESHLTLLHGQKQPRRPSRRAWNLVRYLVMAYNEALAQRVGALLARRRGITQKKMFGGLCFLVDGKMLCGVERNRMVVRVGPERYEALLKEPHVKPMDFTGRPLRGFLYVLAPGFKTPAQLKRWVDLSCAYAASLPKKK